MHVLFGDNAMEAFKRYYDKYNDDNLVAMYDGRVFGYSGWHIFGQDFIKECFRYKGLPDKCYDIAVDKGLIIPIPDDAKEANTIEICDRNDGRLEFHTLLQQSTNLSARPYKRML